MPQFELVCQLKVVVSHVFGVFPIFGYIDKRWSWRSLEERAISRNFISCVKMLGSLI